jgi:hypothetical protein
LLGVTAGAEEGEEALGVPAGAEVEEGDEEEGDEVLRVGAVAVDGVLGVTAGAEVEEGEEEEGEVGEEEEERDVLGAAAVDGLLSKGEEEEGDTVGVVPIGENGAGVTAGAAVTYALGVPVVYVTFFTTPKNSLEK